MANLAWRMFPNVHQALAMICAACPHFADEVRTKCGRSADELRIRHLNAESKIVGFESLENG